mgnify:CR=1 FL=1
MIDGFLYCDAETELDLSRYPKLKTLTIDSLSYQNVNVTKFIGMSELESVVIGSHCFSKTENGQFYLKNCPKLKSLKIGSSSFFKYNVFEIENVDALEEIEIGELDDLSGNFYFASLKLKSVTVERK